NRVFATLLILFVLILFTLPRRAKIKGREVPTPSSDVISTSASAAEENPPAAEPDPPVSAAADASTEVAAPVTSKPETVKPDTLALEIHALQAADMLFRSDGQPTEPLSMMQGESATLRADKEGTLILSNTAALSAKLNGKPLSFGAGMHSGEFVITRDGIDAS